MSNVRNDRLHIEGLNIHYGDHVAVNDANIVIEPGEFFTLLGPSGCGKTTLLRAIAGFIRQSSGDIRMGERTWNTVPAHKRNTGMVFQNYAVFPHLNVWDNVAYGLRGKGYKKSEIEKRVTEALSLVDLGKYKDRKPRNLSGGQQQRVVIARATVIQPHVLLMDEPLANLDAQLRVRLREDVRELQKRLGIMTIYVTHDQEEALSISDRIAVMSDGKVQQVGTPEEIYMESNNRFVAEFVGEATFYQGAVVRGGNGVELENGVVLSSFDELRGSEATVAIRPEKARIVNSGEDNAIRGIVTRRAYLGSYIQLNVDIGLKHDLKVRIDPRDSHIETNDEVYVAIDRNVFVFDGSTTDGAEAVERVEASN